MSIYARLLGDEQPRISGHAFATAFGELERGKVTQGQLAALFGLSSQEQAELAALAARAVSAIESVSICGRTVLTNLGQTPQVCGLVSIQAAGVTGVEFVVAINRNGSGTTLTFQLTDATGGLPGTQIAVVTDTAGAGDKLLTPQVVTLAQPLQAGLRRLAFLANAGNNTDDPIVLGTTLLIRRVDNLSALVVHEIVLLATWDHDHGGVLGLGTPAGLRARLGV